MNLTDTQIEMIKSKLSPINTTGAFVEMLNECYEPVKVCGYEYDQANILKSVDPIAFQCGEADYISSMLDDCWIEIEGEFYDLHEVETLIEE